MGLSKIHGMPTLIKLCMTWCMSWISDDMIELNFVNPKNFYFRKKKPRVIIQDQFSSWWMNLHMQVSPSSVFSLASFSVQSSYALLVLLADSYVFLLGWTLYAEQIFFTHCWDRITPNTLGCARMRERSSNRWTPMKLWADQSDRLHRPVCAELHVELRNTSLGGTLSSELAQLGLLWGR